MRSARERSIAAAQRHVRGDMKEIEIASRQTRLYPSTPNSAPATRCGRARVAAGVYRRLVQRRGDDAVDGAGAGERAGPNDIAGGGVARHRADRAGRNIRHGPAFLHHFEQLRNRSSTSAGDCSVRTTAVSPPINETAKRSASASPMATGRQTARSSEVTEQRLGSDLLPNAGNIPNRDAQKRQCSRRHHE